MSEDVKENGKGSKKTEKVWNKGPRFGIEKPAIPGPGRPRMPESLKARRQLLREKIEEIAPDAIRVVGEILNDARTEDKDRLRAAEIALSHTVPKLEETEIHDERPLPEYKSDDLSARLAIIRASHRRSSGSSDPGGTEVAA